MKRIFSGVQPTGNLHLGNYLGAIRNFVRLQHQYDCIFCVVDLHALTLWQEPEELRSHTREVTAAYLAAGIDPQKNVVFNQSQVRAHAELAWIFNCVARIGWLNRMTQFKEKAGKHRENASAGLYVYPNLMAADILAYKATHVPVGDDQRQHLELCRDIAQKFNHDYKTEFFPIIEPLILGAATRVMSLRDGSKKMSKSDPSDMSRINMTDGPDEIAKKLRKATTDPDLLPGPGLLAADGSLPDETRKTRPEAFNLLGIYAALADEDWAAVLTEFEGKGFGDFKKALVDLAVAKVGPIGDEMKRLTADPGAVDAVLRDGAERARALSEPILRECQDIVGLLRP
ncbi:tryptophanyl-tRNA synthetase [Tistlia consotensis]|uniref:Tryptophan--tRNA ligase n=1 Tax=Tistlia consotensis USBA 355 TaxID=560819 RepID=A0A1Y6CTV8_9PROT|nr:tryptophan--tRNA ligase [Tistlia consotensis]SMF74220.1 tryptophanyl-tRNA synthetase [Tistlia consotensis USBA 355]SNS10346.1 tryptophanyl-tRNA synthetase [Tistlia consotensis]